MSKLGLFHGDRQHLWFLRALADYLVSLPTQLEAIHDEIDDSVVNELVSVCPLHLGPMSMSGLVCLASLWRQKLAYPYDAIVRALRASHVSNEIKVAYQLVVDHRLFLANGSAS